MGRIGDRGEMEAFVRSIELGGFSAAARELKLTPSALSKLVSRLESSLKIRLLNRTTRKLTPTAEGELFLSRCRRILAEMEDAENEIGGSRERPRGKLRMNVGVGFGTHQLVPALPRFLERYPGIQLELGVEDRVVDLQKENIDIAMRAGPPPEDLALVARKICEVERVVCASPKYLARHGAPRSPDDLARHTCITVSGPYGSGQWKFDLPSGRRVMDVVSTVSVNNAECLLRLAVLGVGIVRTNEFIVGEDLRKGSLVRVLSEFHCAEPVPMMALYPHLRQRLPRVAVMLDFLLASFGHAPWRTAVKKKR
jgi:DNA-binding transcriptional LysR family regulator